MGFGQRSQPAKFSLPGEEFGLLRPLKQWSNLSITRIPIGYELSANHLQMAMAIGAMANGGKLMEPRLIKAVMDDKGRVVQQFMPKVVRQVVRPETAVKVIDAMRAVVEQGTGKNAAVAGYHAAGKTGTSWKHESGDGYQKDYFSSFAGLIPAEDPQFVISVVVDAPKDAYYGGAVAAPAFSEIATRVVQYANLAPTSATDAYARRVP
jgi:cell division protein FtsI/penicillin-binding protein 2